MIWLLGLGASAGACVRYYLTNLIKFHLRSPFPYATLILNLSGTLILAFFVGMHLNHVLYTVLGIGFLGGYTTFSTFNTELFTLIHSCNYKKALLYGFSGYIIGPIIAALGLFIGHVWFLNAY